MNFRIPIYVFQHKGGYTARPLFFASPVRTDGNLNRLLTKLTRELVARPSDNDLVAPARPASAADSTNAINLYLSTSYPSESARGSFSRIDFNTCPNGEWMTR